MIHSFDEELDDDSLSECIKDPLLDTCLERVNQVYFQGKRRLPIGWSELPDSIWAHYIVRDQSIRINSRVKNREAWTPKPPSCFLEYLIFHEILHDVYPSVLKNGRRYDHPAEFRRHERKFPGYDEIHEWEILEASARTGTKFAKFGTLEYQKLFSELTKSPLNSQLAYFHQYGDVLKDKWAVLGVDPARRKYCLQAIKLSDSTISWFHPYQCVWR